jgi:hypothetical protein
MRELLSAVATDVMDYQTELGLYWDKSAYKFYNLELPKWK